MTGSDSPAGRWARRPLARMLFGMLLVLGASTLQLWNETRSAGRERLLHAARDAVVVLDQARLDPANDGALVHLSGVAVAAPDVGDPELGQPTDGLALRRRVEVFQWHERGRDGPAGTSGAGQIDRTSGAYYRDWHDRPIDHRRFKQPVGHENPVEFPLQERIWRAPVVQVGELRLSDAVADRLRDWQPVPVDLDRLPENLRASLRTDGMVLTNSDPADEPRIGDLRISFQQIPGGPVSIIAAQQSGWLHPWTHRAGELVLVARGYHSPTTMLQSEAVGNSMLGWSVWLAGLLLGWVGLVLMFRPVAAGLGVSTTLGRGSGRIALLAGAIGAALLSTLMLVSGQLLARPWVLSAVAVAMLVLVGWRISRRPAAARTTPDAPDDDQLPPPPQSMPPLQ